MPEESIETRRVSKPASLGAPPPEHEHLPCPRCDSTNTKFCYYNNYNFSQPRHFCKSCRRYWTHGGTLRDIPIGGGSRKNAKRSRTVSGSNIAHAVATSVIDNIPLSSTPVLLPLAVNHCDRPATALTTMSGSFTSLLNTQGHGFLALGGMGLGMGPGFEEMGFGLGRGIWNFPPIVDGGAGAVGGSSNGSNVAAGWQYENGEHGFVGGECFQWPDLAISTPGSGLK